jgi:exodeoxyribonuclease VII small subunit
VFSALNHPTFERHSEHPLHRFMRIDMARQKKALGFEQSLNDLQVLVERLESGDLSLEESLATFEQGIGLTRECQSALQDAEQRVQTLLEQNGTLIEKPLDGSTLP